MKKTFFLPVLTFTWSACLAALVMTPAAFAQEADTQYTASPAHQIVRPAITTPDTVAMIYSKLTRQLPDFDSLARQTQAYKDASDFERSSVQDSEAQKIKEAYRLLTVTEPLVVETQVKLSSYNTSNHGFFVENFKSSTFFPVGSGDKLYAFVPQDIMDKQWLKVDDEAAAKAIATTAANNGGMLSMTLLLMPQYADTSSASIDGENYWPIVVDVKKMMLYAPDGTPLWQPYDASLDKTHQELLKLYQ